MSTLPSGRPSLLLLTCALLAGCPDPGGAFDEFAGRVPDASVLPEGCPEPSGTPLPSLPDISGEALFALRLGFAGGAPPVLLVVEQTQTTTGATGVLDMSFRFVHRDTHMVLAGEPIVRNDIAIASSGEFCIPLGDLAIPGDANPLMTGNAMAEDVFIIGRIDSADLSCGEVTGMVTMPSMVPLGGSTFGSIRIEPGTMGDDLPEPVSACP